MIGKLGFKVLIIVIVLAIIATSTGLASSYPIGINDGDINDTMDGDLTTTHYVLIRTMWDEEGQWWLRPKTSLVVAPPSDIWKKTLCQPVCIPTSDIDAHGHLSTCY